jgi:hypothetical protein
MFGVVQIQQFGLMEVGDDGQVMLVALSGRRSSGTLLPGMRIELRCDAAGCAPLQSAK